MVRCCRRTRDAWVGPTRWFLELDVVLDQELVGRGVLVREGAHQVAVAVAALHVVVADPVQEHLVRRVLDTVLLLVAGAAAEVHVAARAQAVPADVGVLLHHDHGGAVIDSGDGRRESRRAGADGDQIRRQVPEVLRLRLAGPCAESGQRGGADAGGRALPEKGSPTDARILPCRLGHKCPPRRIRTVARVRTRCKADSRRARRARAVRPALRGIQSVYSGIGGRVPTTVMCASDLRQPWDR